MTQVTSLPYEYTTEGNRLCGIVNGDHGDDDIENENENATAKPTQEDEGMRQRIAPSKGRTIIFLEVRG